MAEGLFYRCNRCGNIVALIHQGEGTLACCGADMELLVANSTDAALEKHVPVVTKTATGIHVEVGSTLHPMTEEHHIEFIAVVTDDDLQIRYLKPGDEPKADFDRDGKVYAYCNLHGLWTV